jgi:hypothetical protein
VKDNQVWAATAIGAAIGGVIGYLFFTDRGRMVRHKLEPTLEDFVRELNGFRSTFQRAVGAANDSWKVLTDMVGESPQTAHRYPQGQTSPF